MFSKGFLPLFIWFVILTVPTGCDNVAWDGSEIRLEPPPPAPGSQVVETEEEEEERLEPVLLGPLVYLVERVGAGGDASIIPIAERRGPALVPLPDPAETPDLVERFPVGRWEEGTEFVLFDQGQPAGRFFSQGTSEADDRFCLIRPRGSGVVQLRPEAMGRERFFALRSDEVDRILQAHQPLPVLEMTDAIRNASLDAARTLIPQRQIPWPPTVLGIRRRIDIFGAPDGSRSLAASFIFGDDLQVGRPEPLGYSLFLVSRDEGSGFTPVFSWYRRADAGPKAFPGFLAAHDLRRAGEMDVLVEMFGVDARWLALLGREGTDPTGIVYQDPCGVPLERQGMQDHQEWGDQG